jgi:hypothetical protein
MTSKQSRHKNRRQNHLPESPPSPPQALAVVLEVSAEDLARVRRWAEQNRDASIAVKIRGRKLSLRGITPEELWKRLDMYEVFGVTDSDLQRYLGRGVAGSFFQSALVKGTPEDQYTEAIKIARALLQGMAPRNTEEALLVVQMIGTHNAAMNALRQTGRADLSLEFHKYYANCAVKLRRLFLEEMKALRQERGGGMQQVVVKHVQVNEGGQAIVGHIETGRKENPEGRV